MNTPVDITIGALSLILGFGTTVCLAASIYDLSQTKQQSDSRRHPYRRHWRKRPLVSIVIKIQGSSDQWLATLQSIGSNSYRKTEIVIMARSSSAALKAQIAEFTGRYPKRKINLIKSRSIKTALKHINGEVVMVLAEPVLLDKQALKQAVWSLSGDDKIKILELQQRLQPTADLLNLSNRFEAQAWAQVKKALSALNLIRPTPKQSILAYRAAALTDIKVVSQARYAAQAVVYGRLQPPKFLSWVYTGGLSVFGTYVIYLSVSRATSYPLAILWLSAWLFLFLALWDDEHLSITGKSKLCFILPIMPGLLYLLAVMRTLLWIGGLIRAVVEHLLRLCANVAWRDITSKVKAT